MDKYNIFIFGELVHDAVDEETMQDIVDDLAHQYYQEGTPHPDEIVVEYAGNDTEDWLWQKHWAAQRKKLSPNPNSPVKVVARIPSMLQPPVTKHVKCIEDKANEQISLAFI